MIGYLHRRFAPEVAPAGGLAQHDSDDALIPLESLADLVGLTSETPQPPMRAGSGELAQPLPRGQRTASANEPDAADSGVEDLQPPLARSASSWIVSTTVIAVAFVIMVIGIHHFMGGLPISGVTDDDFDELEDVVISNSNEQRNSRSATGIGSEQGSISRRRREALTGKPGGILQPPPWTEPEDNDPVPGDDREEGLEVANHRGLVPDWARATATAPPSNPVVVVRRVAEPSGSLIKPTLHVALDEIRGGIAELADQGPLPIEDVNISGESRLIRARPGYRPIVYVERSSANSVRHPSSVLSLERKNVTFEGLDFIVNVLDLTSRQTAFFTTPGRISPLLTARSRSSTPGADHSRSSVSSHPPCVPRVCDSNGR